MNNVVNTETHLTCAQINVIKKANICLGLIAVE